MDKSDWKVGDTIRLENGELAEIRDYSGILYAVTENQHIKLDILLLRQSIRKEVEKNGEQGSI